MVKQGDIIRISFDPSRGHEQNKHRPALVISNNVYNENCGGMALVCPISHAKEFPLHIDLPEGLQTSGKVLMEHIRAMDIEERTYQYVESVPDVFLSRIRTIAKSQL